jgi:hypothetical protein
MFFVYVSVGLLELTREMYMLVCMKCYVMHVGLVFSTATKEATRPQAVGCDMRCVEIIFQPSSARCVPSSRLQSCPLWNGSGLCPPSSRMVSGGKECSCTSSPWMDAVPV